MRVFTVSRGNMAKCSTMPAVAPATRCCQKGGCAAAAAAATACDAAGPWWGGPRPPASSGDAASSDGRCGADMAAREAPLSAPLPSHEKHETALNRDRQGDGLLCSFYRARARAAGGGGARRWRR